jgi:non-canonical purine NTP pyrophosphatase (RdgB/HAM1 family)
VTAPLLATPLGPLVFVTSNPGKAREASAFLGCALEATPLHLPELQSLDFAEVVRAKAVAAAECLGVPVLVEDSGIGLTAWGGYPGPLTRWAVNAAGEAGFARMLDGFEDRSAEAVSALGVARPGDDPARVLVALGRVRGTLAREPRGAGGFGWDVLFVPEGESRTFAEMSPEEKNALSHRARAFEILKRLLS